MPAFTKPRLRWAAAAMSAAMMVLTAPAFADDDDDDDDGRKRGRQRVESRVEDDGKRYEYRYRDARCNYRYRFDYRTGETDLKQKGDCRHVAQPMVVSQPSPVPRVVQPVPARTTSRCDRERLGRVLGGVVGGVIGSQIGKDSGNQAVGVIGGAIIGVVLGGAIGKSMDDSDRACVGQALEWGQSGQRVAWQGNNGVGYIVQPGPVMKQSGRTCRDFTTRMNVQGKIEDVKGRACRGDNGVWQVV